MALLQMPHLVSRVPHQLKREK